MFWKIFDKLSESCLISTMAILWAISISLVQRWCYYAMNANCTLHNIFSEGECNVEDVDVIALTLFILIYFAWLLFFTRLVMRYVYE